MTRAPRQVAIWAAAYPEQALIVRYNDIPTLDRVDPHLTTINIGHEDMGGQAAEIAAGEHHTAATLVPTRLVLRGSTRRPPGA
jgi:LacI family transcriptional regulator